MRSGTMPSRIHQTDKRDSRPKPVLAKGPRLSLRIRSGNPYSANARSKRRRVASKLRMSKARRTATQTG